MTFTSFSTLLVALLIGTLRLQVALFVVPFFGPGLLHGMPRRLLIVVSVIVVWPLLMPVASQAHLSGPIALAVAGKEAILGAIIGFFCGGIFWAIESAGELIDLQRGSTAAGVFNPMFGATNSPLGNLFVRLFGVVFWCSGGFLVFLDIILKSFQIYPPYSLMPAFGSHTVSLVCSIIESLFKLGLLFAAPILIVFLLTDLALGLMNRFVPQLNVFFLSMPVKSAVGLFFLLFYFTILLEAFDEHLFTSDQALSFLKAIFSR